MHFTEPYSETPSVLVVRSGEPEVDSIEDMHGKRVCVPRGFFTQDYLERAHPEIELVLFDDALACLYAVLEARADAALDSNDVAALRKKRGQKPIRSVGCVGGGGMNAVKGLFEDESGVYARRGEPDLVLAREVLHGQEYHQAKSEIMAGSSSSPNFPVLFRAGPLAVSAMGTGDRSPRLWSSAL